MNFVGNQGTIMLRNIILIVLFFSYKPVYGQSFVQSDSCITDTLINPEFAFTRTDHTPLYKGNFKRFLTDNIDIGLFLRDLQSKDTVFTDTARVKFIMSKNSKMSNFSISKVHDHIFGTEVIRLIRLASCNWQPANQGGRFVNSWVQFDIYFSLTSNSGEIKMNIDYKNYDPPEEPM